MIICISPMTVGMLLLVMWQSAVSRRYSNRLPTVHYRHGPDRDLHVAVKASPQQIS